MVRELLNGRLANTAFMIFDPQGTRKLTRSGRSPSAVVKGRGSPNARPGQADTDKRLDDATMIKEMQRISARYTPADTDAPAVLQDFNSFRQALNVAAADQRLLVAMNVKEKDQPQVKEKLEQVFSASDIVGKFHLNIMDPKVDAKWSSSVQGDTSDPGIYIIRAGTFGLTGVVMNRLPEETDVDEIKAALVVANDEYSIMETRKKYSQHVMAGKRQGIYFENEIGREGASDNRRQSDRQRRRK